MMTSPITYISGGVSAGRDNKVMATGESKRLE